MSDQLNLRILEQAGIEPSSAEMQVLGTALEFSTDAPEKVTVDSIHKAHREKGNPVTWSWIYKCLKSLAERGFVFENSIKKPHEFTANRETILIGIHNTLTEKLDEKSMELDSCRRTLNMLRRVDHIDLSIHLFERMLGKHLDSRTRIIEGVDNVKSTLMEDLIRRAVPNDVIRIIEDLNIEETDILSEIRETVLLRAVHKGCVLRVVLIPPRDVRPDIVENVVNYIRSSTNVFNKPISSGALELRVYPTEKSTYRMVSLNNEMMILFLTNAVVPDICALVQREDNSLLIDESISTFEGLWANSVDVKSELEKSRAA